jgi:hypothetical protein
VCLTPQRPCAAAPEREQEAISMLKNMTRESAIRHTAAPRRLPTAVFGPALVGPALPAAWSPSG